jgi:hypothetical protein
MINNSHWYHKHHLSPFDRLKSLTIKKTTTITYPFCGFFVVINLSWLTIVNFAEIALVNKIYCAAKKDIPLLVNENGRWTGMKT